MQNVGRHRQTASRRAIVVGMVVAVWLSLFATGAGAAPTSTPDRATKPAASRAQEVRTVWTGELGVDRPAGLAYDPSRREFLVAGDDAAGTPVLRLGPDEQDLGTVTLPELTNPATLAFDAAAAELTAIDGGDAVQVPSDALDVPKPRAARASIDSLQLEAPESATFDPATGTWFVLDGGDSIAVVAGGNRRGPVGRIALAPADGDRVIAFNPTDELVYVLDAGAGRIEAVDRRGDVRKRFELGSTELQDPVAMTFAPSTDTTDDPANRNLYVADAGSAQLLGGVTELSLAAVSAAAAPADTATLVQTIDTSKWTPASPDPSGVVWTQTPAEPLDELVVVDSEVDETTGAGWNNVNLWRSRRDGTVAGTGATYGPNAPSNYSREPTGAGYDVATSTLFVSDDDKRKIFVVKRGPDGLPGTRDDVVTSIDTAVYGGVDTEDPEFDPVSGHLFYLDGVGMEIYRINPVDGVFGNGNDTMTQFDISHLGPVDFEGLTSNPQRRTLYVGARTTKQIFEITHNGTLVRTIFATGITGLKYISGLAVAPASTGGGDMHLWIVDRAVDNGPDPTENDGKMFEINAPNIGGTPVNGPPVATDDAASTSSGTPVTVSVLDNDSDPDGDPLTVTNLTQPSNGSAQVNPNQTITYTPNAEFTGTDTFTYRANDGQIDSNVATVAVTVAGGGGGTPPSAPTFRSAASAIITKSSGSTLTIARPAGVQAGDLLLAQVRHRTTSKLIAPSGWTEIGTIQRTAAHHSVYYKVAGGSEPTSYSFNQVDSKGRMAGGIGAYYGVDPASPINAWAASAANTATLVAPSATSTVDNAMVVRLWGWRGPQATDPGVGFNVPPAGVTQRWSEQVPHSNDDRNRVLAGDHVQAAAGPVGTATAGGSASTLENRRSSFTVILAPAPSG